MRRLLGDGARISAVVSPFERTQQTLYCMQQELQDEDGRGVHVRYVHVDPRVREQEFGNFQAREDMQLHRETASEVGRFWYRRPTGESSADVYDRAATFWESVLDGHLSPKDRFSRDKPSPDDALVVVTHGLTMRLLLMRYFQWSPQTFDAVYNPGNADMWVLTKRDATRSYALEPSECSPPRMPWATRQIYLVVRGRDGGLERQPYTLVDYLSLPQPRSSNPDAALKQLIRGHGHPLDPCRCEERASEDGRARFIDSVMARVETVEMEHFESVDWWCGRISEQGKKLRTDNEALRLRSAHRSRGVLGQPGSPSCSYGEGSPSHMASTSCRNALGQQGGSPASSNGEGAGEPPPSPTVASTASPPMAPTSCRNSAASTMESTSHDGTERGNFMHEAASSMPSLPSMPSLVGGVHDRGCANAGGAADQRAVYEAAAEGADSGADGSLIASPSSMLSPPKSNDPKRPSSKLSASSGSASPERMCSASPVPPSLSTAVSSAALESRSDLESRSNLESRSRSPLLEGRIRPRALPSPNRAMLAAMLDDHGEISELTCTPRGLSGVRTGHAYQTPALGYVPEAQGGLPPGHRVLYVLYALDVQYGVGVPASGVGHVQRTVAPQASSPSGIGGRRRNSSTATRARP